MRSVTVRNEHHNTFEPEGEDEPTWASLHANRAELMVTRGERSASAGEHSVLFYLYCDDVAEARASLQAAGVACGEVSFPFWSPRGEFEVCDPDGYVLMVSHT
jgi:hypothetical protein